MEGESKRERGRTGVVKREKVIELGMGEMERKRG